MSARRYENKRSLTTVEHRLADTNFIRDVLVTFAVVIAPLFAF